MTRLRILPFGLVFFASLGLGAEPITLSTRPSKELVLYAPRPGYPYFARTLHETGTGIFVLTVNENTGKVTAIDVAQSTGHKRLDWACIKPFMMWRFKPHMVKKVKIPVSFTMTRI